MTGPVDPRKRAEEDRTVLATRRMIGVALLLLIVVTTGLLAYLWVQALRTPSSTPSRQYVQIGTVCPDPQQAP